jgi:glycosyltransferase involved in cell wall biosynthesis
MTKIDLHVHSAASLTTGEWFSVYFGCPESYADPVAQYERCKESGMTLVTLTDHDTIEGGLRLQDKPDFFLSEEVSAHFPENGCVLHVLVWNLTPAQHTVIEGLRRNIYDLVRYLRQQGLAHGLAHPLLSPNWRLDAETLEKALVLFPCLERHNGLFDRRLDADVGHLVNSITPALIARLADKHRLDLPAGGPRLPVIFSGSDDHELRRSGSNYTEVDGDVDAAGFFAALADGRARAVGSPARLDTMATCINVTTHEHLRQRSEFRTPAQDIFVDFASILAGRGLDDAGADHVVTDVRQSLLWAVQKAGVAAGPHLDMTAPASNDNPSASADIATSTSKMADQLFSRGLMALAEAVLGWDVYKLFASLRDLGTALSISTPFLFAANDFGHQFEQVERIWKGWTAFSPPAREPHVAVFSDSLEAMQGGVAAWCSRFGSAAAKAKKSVWLATCGESGSDDPLPTIARFEIPFYDGFDLVFPSLTATIERLWRKGITHVELSTPGPAGIVGLLAARLLGLPVTSSYHTDLPDLLRDLTKQKSIGDVCEKYLRFFYRAVDRVFAFSQVSLEKLERMGVPGERIELVPSAVDPNDFSPERRSPTTFKDLGLDLDGHPVILSVGRLSSEKNIPMIVEAVRLLQHRVPSPRLVVVGDGPERTSLEGRYRDVPFVSILGFQSGAPLRALYASASLFAFASKVDTLGLVNLEAMASGLPVLVPEDSAIARFLRDGENAVLYPCDAASLARGIALLLDRPDLHARLAENGRTYTLKGWKDGSFEHVWKRFLVTAGNRSTAQPRA